MTGQSSSIQPVFDRNFNSRGWKPASVSDVKIGGWAEAYAGRFEDGLDEQRVIFGCVVAISQDQTKIYLQVADTVFSPEKTGIARDSVIELELADLCAAEYSPEHQDWEAYCVRMEIENKLFSKYEEEFNRRYPQYALETHPPKSFTNPKEWQIWLDGWSRAQRAFLDELIAQGRG
jgi:hypothetical protein